MIVFNVSLVFVYKIRNDQQLEITFSVCVWQLIWTLNILQTMALLEWVCCNNLHTILAANTYLNWANGKFEGQSAWAEGFDWISNNCDPIPICFEKSFSNLYKLTKIDDTFTNYAIQVSLRYNYFTPMKSLFTIAPTHTICTRCFIAVVFVHNL